MMLGQGRRLKKDAATEYEILLPLQRDLGDGSRKNQRHIKNIISGRKS